MSSEAGGTYLLFDLQLIHVGRQLAQDLVRPLVVLQLRGDQVREVPQRFGGIQHVLHHAHRLLRLRHELVLGLFDLLPGLLAQILIRVLLLLARRPGRSAQVEPGAAFGLGLGRVEVEPRVLDAGAGALGEHQIRVERRAPAGQEAGLDRGVLRETRLAHLLLRDGVLLERLGEGFFGDHPGGGRGGVDLGEGVRGGERGAGEGVRKGLGLRLRLGGSS